MEELLAILSGTRLRPGGMLLFSLLVPNLHCPHALSRACAEGVSLADASIPHSSSSGRSPFGGNSFPRGPNGLLELPPCDRYLDWLFCFIFPPLLSSNRLGCLPLRSVSDEFVFYCAEFSPHFCSAENRPFPSLFQSSWSTLQVRFREPPHFPETPAMATVFPFLFASSNVSWNETSNLLTTSLGKYLGPAATSLKAPPIPTLSNAGTVLLLPFAICRPTPPVWRVFILQAQSAALIDFVAGPP